MKQRENGLFTASVEELLIAAYYAGSGEGTLLLVHITI